MRETDIRVFQNSLSGRPILLLGNGPSLNLLDDYTIPNGIFTLGMNRSWKKLVAQYHCIMFHKEHLDELVAGEWDNQHTMLFAFTGTNNEKWLNKIKRGDVSYVTIDKDRDQNIAGMVSTWLDSGSYANMTGHFAIELALWMGCNPIYLLGFDCYGGHFCDDKTPDDDWQEVQVELFEMTSDQLDFERPDTEIYNLNPDSAIVGWKKKDIGEVLNEIPTEDS